jgi:hypothetical protein
MAGITLALKLAFIANLVYLAIVVTEAIAAAIPDFGASTATIPGFVAVVRLLCGELLDRVIQIIARDIAEVFRLARRLFEKVGFETLGKESGAVARTLSKPSSGIQDLGPVVWELLRSEERWSRAC